MTLRYRALLPWALVPLAICLGIAAGYRYFGEGRDYLNYLSVYENIRLSDSLDATRFEPGFMLATWIAKFHLELRYPAFMAILATIALWMKFNLFSQHRRPILTVLFYLCCWYPLHEYTQIRLAVGLSFGMLAATFMFQGRLIAFAIAMAIAVSFHASSLILAVLLPTAYLLSGFRLPLVITGIIAFAIGGAGLSASIFSLAAHFNTLVDTYITNLDGNTVNILSGANLLTATCLVGILFSGSLQSRKDVTFFILILFGLAATVALQTAPVFSHRIKEMLLVFLVPLAFNAPLTKKALPQYTTAGALAAWSLYSAISQGIIGGGA